MKEFNVKNKIIINDSDDFELVCTDILTEFLESFSIENGLLKVIEDGEREIYPENAVHGYTMRGIYLAETMIRRLYKIGKRYFPNDDISIESYLYFTE